MYFFIPPEPSQLSFGVMAGVLLDEFNSSVEVIFSVKGGEEFSVSDRLEAVEVPFGVHGFGFFDESVGDHLLHTCVYARV